MTVNEALGLVTAEVFPRSFNLLSPQNEAKTQRLLTILQELEASARDRGYQEAQDTVWDWLDPDTAREGLRSARYGD